MYYMYVLYFEYFLCVIKSYACIHVGTNTCDVTMTTELPLATEKAEHDVHVCSKPLGPQLEKDVFFAGVGMFPLLETTPTPNRGAGVSASGLIMPTNKDSTLRYANSIKHVHVHVYQKSLWIGMNKIKKKTAV